MLPICISGGSAAHIIVCYTQLLAHSLSDHSLFLYQNVQLKLLFIFKNNSIP